MQKPSLGRVVFVKVDPAMNSGSDTAHAVITRVWSDELVNIRIMLDAFTMPLWMTSVALREAEDDAVAKGHACYWPPRI